MVSIKVYIKASTGSTATMLAKDVANTLSKGCDVPVSYKVSTISRDVYKITWFYYDLPGVSQFVNTVRRELAIAEDDFEYDVNGLPILPTNNADTINPEVVIKNWVDSGKFDLMAKMYYGLTTESKLYIKSMKKESTGRNARDYERIFGKPVENNDKVITMTIRVKQLADINKTSDTDWNVKCIDELFRYYKVYDGSKKVKLPEDELHQLYDILTYNSVTKRRNTINIIPKANRNVDDVVSTIDAFIDKYYPDIQYDLSISGDKIVITVE